MRWVLGKVRAGNIRRLQVSVGSEGASSLIPSERINC
jgi:hypothetical protein